MNEWEMTEEQLEQMLLQEQQEIEAENYQRQQELLAANYDFERGDVKY